MVLLLLSVSVLQSPGQQTETSRKPFDELKAKAEAGDPNSESQLGLRYANGQGVAKDEVEAVKWLRKAAEQNVAQAQTNLGFCYESGQGVVKDEVEGYRWFLLAAAQGDEDAKTNMALSERRLTREQIVGGIKMARNFKPREMPSVGR